ncbi:unnamed protein product [Mesocestoides corti]|uniref:SHQ1 domain-containing protein n=1 Tax=Mesocestoides corti TaxID=53468 RepID=A0A0R3UF42_MESCO|nr:unnamed protein product [Mesocestoides corti]
MADSQKTPPLVDVFVPKPRISEDSFDELPTMAFEPCLVAPWQHRSDGHPVEIPICFGGPVVCLRDLHEKQLAEGNSFLDEYSCLDAQALEDLHEEAETLADWLIYECNSYEECRCKLIRKTPLLVFETILCILGRMEAPMFPLSERTCKLLQRLSLLEPVHPHSTNIAQVIYDEAMSFCADPDSDRNTVSTPHVKSSSLLPQIVNFIEQTYSCNNVSRQDRLRLVNIFNKRLFQDLYMVMEVKTRNVIRLLIRGLFFIVRRYAITMCIDSKAKQEETWMINTIMTRPHIFQYAIVTIAEKVGPLLFRFPLFTCLQQELAVRVIVNIFCSNTDRMWYPGQRISDITIDTGSAKCHQGCNCHHDA